MAQRLEEHGRCSPPPALLYLPLPPALAHAVLWQPVREVVRPASQLELTATELEEEIARALTAGNPAAPANLVRYSCRERGYRAEPIIDQQLQHFSLGGCLMHRDSDEAARERQSREAAALAARSRRLTAHSRRVTQAAGRPSESGSKEGGRGVRLTATVLHGEALLPPGEEAEGGGAGGRLRNQFNFADSGAQTRHQAPHERSTMTEPPPTATASGTCSRWEIFEAYCADQDRQRQTEELARQKAQVARRGGGAGGGGAAGTTAGALVLAGGEEVRNVGRAGLEGRLAGRLALCVAVASALQHICRQSMAQLTPQRLPLDIMAARLLCPQDRGGADSGLAALPASAAKLMERMVAQNLLKEVAMDFKVRQNGTAMDEGSRQAVHRRQRLGTFSSPDAAVPSPSLPPVRRMAVLSICCMFLHLCSLFSGMQYWDDPADAVRTDEGTLLPLWSFANPAARRRAVTALAWSPRYFDMFAVGYGSFDFLHPTTGLVCCYSLKNPGHPEYSLPTPAGVMCLDFHPDHPNLLAAGCYDGRICIFDVRSGTCTQGGESLGQGMYAPLKTFTAFAASTGACRMPVDLPTEPLPSLLLTEPYFFPPSPPAEDGKPLYESSAARGKHSDPVWQVRWQRTDSHELQLVSISTDGRVTLWSVSKNELSWQDLLELRSLRGRDDASPGGAPAAGSSGATQQQRQQQHSGAGGATSGSAEGCGAAGGIAGRGSMLACVGPGLLTCQAACAAQHCCNSSCDAVLNAATHAPAPRSPFLQAAAASTSTRSRTTCLLWAPRMAPSTSAPQLTPASICRLVWVVHPEDVQTGH